MEILQLLLMSKVSLEPLSQVALKRQVFVIMAGWKLERCVTIRPVALYAWDARPPMQVMSVLN